MSGKRRQEAGPAVKISKPRLRWYQALVEEQMRAARVSCSSGRRGRRRGMGEQNSEARIQKSEGPHPGPLPEYRARGKEGAVLSGFAGFVGVGAADVGDDGFFEFEGVDFAGVAVDDFAA